MTDNHTLMRFHVEALFAHDAAGDLVRVNDAGGAPAPRFFLGRTRDGTVCRFRHDLDPATREALLACVHATPTTEAVDVPVDPAPYEAILARTAPVTRTWAGPAFHVAHELPVTREVVLVTAENAAILGTHLAPWLPDVQTGQPMAALVLDGHAVAVCCSVRRTASAHEAGVETVASFRGRGHATRVVARWARAVRALGCVPLYSTSWENGASRAVARHLDLRCFGSDLHLT